MKTNVPMFRLLHDDLREAAWKSRLSRPRRVWPVCVGGPEYAGSCSLAWHLAELLHLLRLLTVQFGRDKWPLDHCMKCAGRPTDHVQRTAKTLRNCILTALTSEHGLHHLHLWSQSFFVEPLHQVRTGTLLLQIFCAVPSWHAQGMDHLIHLLAGPDRVGDLATA